MSYHQKKAFWIVFIAFCCVATLTIYLQGAFIYIDLGGSIIISCLYLIVAIFIRKYIKSNPQEIEQWFQK